VTGQVQGDHSEATERAETALGLLPVGGQSVHEQQVRPRAVNLVVEMTIARFVPHVHPLLALGPNRSGQFRSAAQGISVDMSTVS